MLHNYEVIVGNIGTVYAGNRQFDAARAYQVYHKQSLSGQGRAAGESVAFLKDGEIIKEHLGTVAQAEEA